MAATQPGLRALSLPTAVTLAAPAKINAYLRVVGREPSGLHRVDSLLLPLELADRVTLRLTAGDGAVLGCTCDGPTATDPELQGPSNLAARAAALFLAHSGAHLALRIHIHKRIWVAAGLGGGSSDAATTLRGLARLAPRLPPEDLARLAGQLGADVPFFLHGGACRVTGDGRQLQPRPSPPPQHLVLVNPGQQLPTRQVYGALGEVPSPGWTAGDATEQVWWHNDLEPAATALCPAVARARAALESAGARRCMMTGSGATCVGSFPSRSAARDAAENIADTTGFSVVVTRTVGP